MNLSNTQCVFTPNAGKVEDPVDCGVCGRRMDVKRNVYGPTNSVEGMSGGGHNHDLFQCPDRDEKWHQQVVALRREQKKTASFSIAEILEKEINLVLERKQPTKELTVYNM